MGKPCNRVWSNTKVYFSKANRTCIILAMFHYVRRVLECLFLHIYSNPSMVISEFLTMAIEYWGVFGSLFGYSIFHPGYLAPELSEFKYWLYVIIYLFTEMMNCCCHFALRSLRMRGETRKGIPKVLSIYFRVLDLN